MLILPARQFKGQNFDIKSMLSFSNLSSTWLTLVSTKVGKACQYTTFNQIQDENIFPPFHQLKNEGLPYNCTHS